MQAARYDLRKTRTGFVPIWDYLHCVLCVSVCWMQVTESDADGREASIESYKNIEHGMLT